MTSFPEDGFRLKRRTFLDAGAGALFASWLPLQLARAASRTPIELGDLIERAQQLNQKYLAGGEPAEPAYLHEVAAVASRLAPVPAIELGPPFKGIMETAMHHRGEGLLLIEWRMEARTVYPAHNHPNYNGLTVGLEGHCRMRNFQAPKRYPATDSGESFTVLETQNSILEPGRVASLMSTGRDNIHKIHAGEVAVRGMDISTLVSEHVGFAFIDIDEESRSVEGRYEATWKETLGGYTVP